MLFEGGLRLKLRRCVKSVGLGEKGWLRLQFFTSLRERCGLLRRGWLLCRDYEGALLIEIELTFAVALLLLCVRGSADDSWRLGCLLACYKLGGVVALGQVGLAQCGR